MGWFHDLDESGKHEGYPVAYVPRDWSPQPTATALHGGRQVAALGPAYARTGAPLRELGTHAVDHVMVVHGLLLVGAACDCGWRSPRVELRTPLEWSPSSLERPDELDQRLAALWTAHVVAECAPRSVLDQRDVADALANLQAFQKQQLTAGSDMDRALNVARQALETELRKLKRDAG